MIFPLMNEGYLRCLQRGLTCSSKSPDFANFVVYCGKSLHAPTP